MAIWQILILITLVFVFGQLIKANRYLKAIAERQPPLD